MRKIISPYFLVYFTGWLFTVLSCAPKPEQLPDHQQWHTLTLTFAGPETGQHEAVNPFLYYRLQVTFTHNSKSYTVPGFYAADGQAAESGAETGNIWQVRFTPDEAGEWTYKASFRQGENIAISDIPEEGEATAFDGETGTFQVIASDKTGSDFRASGRLNYVGKRYLQFAGTGAYFLKGGADSPENMLAYQDFDGTYVMGDEEQRSGEAKKDEKLHAYEPHLADWHPGDPSWRNGKGKSLIGGMNYLASQGVNSAYFLTMNIGGDGKDVWPYASPEDYTRFDCSKLDQWERVFSHMDSLGIMLHIVVQETENETLLDEGDMGLNRKLYFRELIARFSHHLAVTWNLGEENGVNAGNPKGQSDAQRMAMASYFKQHDPYQHYVVVHTWSTPKDRETIYSPLLGFQDLDGPSLQFGGTAEIHDETISWIERSGEAGRQWVVCLDEIGPAHTGVKPDADDPQHDTVRHEALWGNLMAGGGGVEWYFGYRFAHNDLNAEDWRSRENMWTQTRYARHFFHQHLPFWEMQSADNLLADSSAYCLAKPGEIYAIYAVAPDNLQLNLQDTEGDFTIHWFDPRNGGELQQGKVANVQGGKTVSLGNPPAEADKDWAILVKKK